MEFVKEQKRSHNCGELRASHNGEKVTLMGWVDTRRDHGGLVFLDMRDRYGLIQVVINPGEEATSCAKDVRNEFVIAIEGEVRLRPEGMTNDKMATGDVEVLASRCEVLSAAETPPIQVGDEKVSEMMRLKYRYLDLRSSKLQNYMITRHKVIQLIRKNLDQDGFLEIETPILYKSTPEGARDYLVPSRVSLGHFYALPQSPQTLKQLLMISGFDKYYQIARCFRDEDLRADRQPEFSQIDMELSFVDVEDIIQLNTKLVQAVWKEHRGVDIPEIPRMKYDEAMDRFGCDRPDLRIPWELIDVKELVADSGFRVFDDVAARDGSIKALAVPGAGEFSRGKFDKLTATAKQYGAKGLVWIKSDGSDKLTSPVSKFFSEDKLLEIFKASGGEAGGAVLILADDYNVVCAGLSALRLELAEELGAIDTSEDKLLWVTEFPLLDYVPEDKRWVACHHPFTQPADEDLQILFDKNEAEYGKVKAKAYDLVCNGHEVAGGSIRIHNPKVQRAMFDALRLSEEEIQLKFGFFIEALQYGTPPHGGIAWGVDRLLMILCGTEAIRDVIAFPKTTKAQCLMSDAPNVVERDQLLELGIRLGQAAEENLKGN